MRYARCLNEAIVREHGKMGGAEPNEYRNRRSKMTFGEQNFNRGLRVGLRHRREWVNIEVIRATSGEKAG